MSSGAGSSQGRREKKENENVFEFFFSLQVRHGKMYVSNEKIVSQLSNDNGFALTGLGANLSYVFENLRKRHNFFLFVPAPRGQLCLPRLNFPKTPQMRCLTISVAPKPSMTVNCLNMDEETAAEIYSERQIKKLTWLSLTESCI